MRKWMKEARQNKGLTANQASGQLGISEEYYSQIENGDCQQRFDMTIVQKIADLFEMNVNQIIVAELQ